IVANIVSAEGCQIDAPQLRGQRRAVGLNGPTTCSNSSYVILLQISQARVDIVYSICTETLIECADLQRKILRWTPQGRKPAAADPLIVNRIGVEYGIVDIAGIFARECTRTSGHCIVQWHVD